MGEGMLNTVISAIGTAMGFVMWACYQLIHNYGLAILLFTVVAKAVMFPCNILVQKNSIAMIRMKPKLDKLKYQYIDDKDRLLDEQVKHLEFLHALACDEGGADGGPTLRASDGSAAVCVASVEALFTGTAPELVVTTAGVSTLGLVTDHDTAEFRRVLDVCLTGAFLVVKHAGRVVGEGGSGGHPGPNPPA